MLLAARNALARVQAISFFFESPPDPAGAAGQQQQGPPHAQGFDDDFELLDDDEMPAPGPRHASTQAAAAPASRLGAGFNSAAPGGMANDDDELQRALAASLAESGAHRTAVQQRSGGSWLDPTGRRDAAADVLMERCVRLVDDNCKATRLAAPFIQWGWQACA